MDSQEIENKFACPICFEVPKYKIFQCRNGHIVCEQCANKELRICPQCRVALESNKIRNIALEDMLKEIASIRMFRDKQNRSNAFARWTNQHQPSSSTILDRPGRLVFNVQCQWCRKIPILSARYACLTCRSINCCANCFSTISANHSSNKNQITQCRGNHVFALITTALQDKAFQKLLVERNGEPLLKDVVSGEQEVAAASKCKKCQDWLTEGYICIMDPNPQLFCSSCYTTTAMFRIHKDAFLPVANKSHSLLLIDPNNLTKKVELKDHYVNFSSSVNGLYRIAFQMRKELFWFLLIVMCCFLWDAYRRPHVYITACLVLFFIIIYTPAKKLCNVINK